MTARSAPSVAVLSRPIFNRLSSTLSKAKIKSIRSGWLISDVFLDETLAPVRFVYHLGAPAGGWAPRTNLAGDHAAARYQCTRNYLRRGDLESHRLGRRDRRFSASAEEFRHP